MLSVTTIAILLGKALLLVVVVITALYYVTEKRLKGATLATKWVAGAAILLIGSLAAVVLGRHDGARDRAVKQARIELVWPAYSTMPHEDQVFLEFLGRVCDVKRRKADAGDVVACLREAAANPGLLVPDGIDRAGMPAKLERLLSTTRGGSKE